jgi:hypothetical protein
MSAVSPAPLAASETPLPWHVNPYPRLPASFKRDLVYQCVNPFCSSWHGSAPWPYSGTSVHVLQAFKHARSPDVRTCEIIMDEFVVS